MMSGQAKELGSGMWAGRQTRRRGKWIHDSIPENFSSRSLACQSFRTVSTSRWTSKRHWHCERMIALNFFYTISELQKPPAAGWAHWGTCDCPTPIQDLYDHMGKTSQGYSSQLSMESLSQVVVPERRPVITAFEKLIGASRQPDGSFHLSRVESTLGAIKWRKLVDVCLFVQWLWWSYATMPEYDTDDS